ncbi:MAG: autotransporter outer membrane beta-barrel domain-containing protein, partial [Desulfovibrio sp.]|nr:autotransporter outer membrane beta-barrel domain-containing protein [Desulfovibrio sp.]
TAEPSDLATGVKVRPQTKAVVESRIAAMGILNAGADLVAGEAMRSAAAGASGAKGLAAGDAKTGFAISPFAAVSGGTQRLESGSRVDIRGVSAVAGVAARREFEFVDLAAGVFFEFGSSRFSTHNGFADGDVDGKGHATYTGAGILARLDISDSPLKGLYLEGSFRFGGMQSDWKTDDLRDAATGKRASYDLYSPYHGAHAGLGYVWEVTEAFKLDFYGKWLWTHLYGGDAHVALDPYEFKDIDSHRLRAGMRADWLVSEQFGIYAGAACEREFDGKARAAVYGLDTPSPALKGDTGVFDVGFTCNPSSLPGFKMELGATATAGKRHGIAGNLMLKYEF